MHAMLAHRSIERRRCATTFRRTVQALGIETTRLTDKQVTLLSVPAHLKLLCEVAQGAGTSLSCQTANELYGLYTDRSTKLPPKSVRPITFQLASWWTYRSPLSLTRTMTSSSMYRVPWMNC